MNPFPTPTMLRAVWSVEAMPAAWRVWRDSNRRRTNAVHEAGHLVLLAALGLPGLSASIEADDSSGITRYRSSGADLPDAPSVALRRAGAVACAAACHSGIESELLAAGLASAPGVEWRYSGTPDHAGASSSFGYLFWRGHPHGFAKTFSRAVLSRNLEPLDCIARHLEKTGAWIPDDTPGLEFDSGNGFTALIEAALRYD